MPSAAAAVVEPDRSAATHFSIHARAEPGVMPRLAGLIAKRGLVPERWHSITVASGADLTIDIEIAGLGHDTVEYVASCMRQIIGVELVLVV
jgi:acetolactate synthase small subunit